VVIARSPYNSTQFVLGAFASKELAKMGEIYFTKQFPNHFAGMIFFLDEVGLYEQEEDLDDVY